MTHLTHKKKHLIDLTFFSILKKGSLKRLLAVGKITVLGFNNSQQQTYGLGLVPIVSHRLSGHSVLLVDYHMNFLKKGLKSHS